MSHRSIFNAALSALALEDEVEAKLENEWEDWLATQEHLIAQREQARVLANLVDDWDLLPDADPAEFKPWDPT